MTDTMHKSGFKVQATILLELIHGVESGGKIKKLKKIDFEINFFFRNNKAITAPLSEEQNNVSNPEFLRQHIVKILSHLYLKTYRFNQL